MAQWIYCCILYLKSVSISLLLLYNRSNFLLSLMSNYYISGQLHFSSMYLRVILLELKQLELQQSYRANSSKSVTKFVHPKPHSFKSLQILIVMKPCNTKCSSLFMSHLFSKEVAFFGCYSCTLDFGRLSFHLLSNEIAIVSPKCPPECGLRNWIHHTQAGHVLFSRKNTLWPQEMQSSWL